MNNILKETGTQDIGKVNLNEIWEITYWTKKFKRSEEELRNAIQVVGNSAAAIEKYFNK